MTIQAITIPIAICKTIDTSFFDLMVYVRKMIFNFVNIISDGIERIGNSFFNSVFYDGFQKPIYKKNR